jgi:hypothetical protein
VLVLCGALNISASSAENMPTKTQKLIVDIELISFGFSSEKPYLALWLTKENELNQADSEYKALILLREKVKWLRDLKKFWRNIAREHRQESDAVTGATTSNKKLNYQFEQAAGWQNISLEVVREHGDRELISFPISYDKTCVNGKFEIATFCAQLVTTHF